MSTRAVVDSIPGSKIGMVSLCLVLAGFAVEFLQMLRPGASCYSTELDLFSQIGRIAIYAMVMGFVLSMFGLAADSRPRYALTSFLLFFPFMLLLVLAGDCV